jgi:hypothetical protein
VPPAPTGSSSSTSPSCAAWARCSATSTTPTSRAAQDRQDWAKFAEHLRHRINDLQAHCLAMYGYGLAAPTAGSIDLDFAESGDPADWAVLP